jgi:hypothetical protein
MRLLSALTSILVLLGTAQAAQWPSAYATLETDRAEDCARACTEDTLCNAWLYRDGACGLSASAPRDADPQDQVGLSPNAPAFIRAQFNGRAPASAQPAATPPAVEAQPEDEASLALLGGPEDGALRQRLRQ